MATQPEAAVYWAHQEATRTAFEIHTGRPFPTVRPPWLQRLELDGYNEEIGIAFEYNGQQHYQLTPKYHPGGLADLEKQHERDARKTYLCTRHGVILIAVPYTITIPEISQYVAAALGHIERARPDGPRILLSPPPPKKWPPKKPVADQPQKPPPKKWPPKKPVADQPQKPPPKHGRTPKPAAGPPVQAPRHRPTGKAGRDATNSGTDGSDSDDSGTDDSDTDNSPSDAAVSTPAPVVSSSPHATPPAPAAPAMIGQMVQSLGQWWRREVLPRCRMSP